MIQFLYRKFSEEKVRKWAPLGLMLIFPVLGSLYHLVNRPTERVYSLVTSVDEAIPFVKYFALPYGIWIFYIYVCLIYFFFHDRPSYYRSLVLYTVCALSCYVIYLVFQTTVPRPEVVGDDIVTRIVKYIYKRDQPFNCFPSIHCFSCYMVMRMMIKSPARNRLNVSLISGMSILIILSTFFVKQHVILDAISAFALVEFFNFMFYTLPGLIRRKSRGQQQELQA